MKSGRFFLLVMVLALSTSLFGETDKSKKSFSARIQVSPRAAMRDDVLQIKVYGLNSNAKVTIRAQTQDISGKIWSSRAEFSCDSYGRLDLSKAVPLSGTYHLANSMGLIWSLMPEQSKDASGEYFYTPDSQKILFSLESDGQVIAASEVTLNRYDYRKINRSQVENVPFAGMYYRPVNSRKRSPAILSLGGSEGGLSLTDDRAAMLSSHGFVTLALAYFALPSLPADLNQIPLEYFKNAIDWLKVQPEVDPEKIYVCGLSKGGELALLLAASYPADIKAVAAYTPSSFIWQGLTPTLNPPNSSWTAGGKDLPFLPFIILPGDFDLFPISVLPIYKRSMANQTETSAPAIPVENINGPILMISGGADLMWPSVDFADLIIRRLKAHGFKHDYKQINYPDAGHLIFVPFQPAGTDHFGPYSLGGSMEANGAATADSWEKVIQFLKTAGR